jgi:hypothetical protein
VFTSSTGRRYTLDPGSFDCSSSTITAWRLALKGTPYEGSLDGASYTGDMVAAFVGSGLFTSSLTPARRGDLYVNEGVHTAMCQDGGSDGVFGFDSLSEFNRNELHQASWGEPGDQDGYESVFREYYDDEWNTVLHYNHKADPEDVSDEPAIPAQASTGTVNEVGMSYRAHVQDAGWLAPVRDGQTAGTEGFAKRMEAVKVSPPDGVVLDVYAHVQGIGNLYYDGVKRGVVDPVIGTVGQGRRLEALMVRVVGRPRELEGRTLMLQGHVQGIGWMEPVPEGQWCGIRQQSKRLEAVRMWFE